MRKRRGLTRLWTLRCELLPERFGFAQKFGGSFWQTSTIKLGPHSVLRICVESQPHVVSIHTRDAGVGRSHRHARRAHAVRKSVLSIAHGHLPRRLVRGRWSIPSMAGLAVPHEALSATFIGPGRSSDQHFATRRQHDVFPGTGNSPTCPIAIDLSPIDRVEC